MNNLSIFSKDVSGSVSIATAGGNSIDDIVTKLRELNNEARLLRAGHETWDWGKEVEENDDVDLEDLDLTLEDNDG